MARCRKLILIINEKGGYMLALIGLIVVVLWILGLIGHIGGGFINLLLIVAAILLIANFIGGRTHTEV